MFDPLSAGVELALGFIKAHRTNEWVKLLISLHVSGFCSFCGAWGSGAILHLRAGMPVAPALAFGFCEGLLTMAAIVYYRFRRDPLTKGMVISVPGSVDAALNALAEKESIVSAPGGRKGGEK